MRLGKARYSGEKKEIFKIKDGDNVFRILPPMGNLADAGVYSKYYSVVWGYKDSSNRNRPFVSPRNVNFKTKMVEVDCAAFNRVERLKADLNEATQAAKTMAKNKQPIPDALKKELEILKDLVGQTGRFNIDNKFHMNAMAQDGKIGLLKLASRGMQALRAEFKSLESSGVDATAVENGRFMIVHREGTGLETAYSVRELKEQVQTKEYGLVDRTMPHSLTDSIIARLSAEAYELDSIYPTPTSAEVAEIVAAFERSEDEGKATVDRILGASDAAPAATTQEEEAEAEVEQIETAKASSLSNIQAEQKARARNEAVKEAPTTSVTETVNTKTGEIAETKAAPLNAAAQTDDEFLASLNIKNVAR